MAILLLSSTVLVTPAGSFTSNTVGFTYYEPNVMPKSDRAIIRFDLAEERGTAVDAATDDAAKKEARSEFLLAVRDEGYVCWLCPDYSAAACIKVRLPPTYFQPP